MNTTKKLFSNRQLFQMIWPLMVEQLLNVFVGMVDVLMVAVLGETAVSGVSLVDSINILVFQVLAALAAGGTVVCSQFVGMKNYSKAGRTAAQLILITVLGTLFVTISFLFSGRAMLSLIFGQVEPSVMESAHLYLMITALSFPFLALYNSGAALFRAIGNTQISMRISILMNGINIIGNAICIFGLKMGVAGVAIPTLIARMIAAVLIIVLLQNPNNVIVIKNLSDFKPNREIIHNILSIGIPNGIESGVFQFGKLILQSLVATLGTASIAGFAVASNLVNYLYLPGNALGLAMITIVGQCIGAGENQQAKEYARKLVLINYAVLAVICTILIAGKGYFVGIYNLSTEASMIAQGLLLSHCIAMIIWPPAFLLPYYFRANNMARFTMYVSIFAMWAFRVALAYVFVRILHLSVLWVWYAMYIDWIFRIIVFIRRFRQVT